MLNDQIEWKPARAAVLGAMIINLNLIPSISLAGKIRMHWWNSDRPLNSPEADKKTNKSKPVSNQQLRQGKQTSTQFISQLLSD